MEDQMVKVHAHPNFFKAKERSSLSTRMVDLEQKIKLARILRDVKQEQVFTQKYNDLGRRRRAIIDEPMEYLSD